MREGSGVGRREEGGKEGERERREGKESHCVVSLRCTLLLLLCPPQVGHNRSGLPDSGMCSSHTCHHLSNKV